jgi:hypothetical protein
VTLAFAPAVELLLPLVLELLLPPLLHAAIVTVAAATAMAMMAGFLEPRMELIS